MGSSTLDAAAELRPRAYVRWLAYSLGAFLLVIGLNVLLAWRLDPFGILRDPRGRSLVASDDERKSKFLLNQAYVPANFDALIIGSSASTNWDPNKLTGFRFYNESMPGANASEERRVVEQVFPKGRFKVALVVMSPTITWTHDLADGLEDVSRSEAFGSISSLGLEYQVWRHGNNPSGSNQLPNGSHVSDHHGTVRMDEKFEPYLYPQDAQAFSDFEALVRDLQSHQIRLIFVTYPFVEPFRAVNAKLLADYKRQVTVDFPSIPVIDFNDPEYREFREDASNYADRIHLSPKGAETLSRIMDERMHALLDGK